MKPKQQFLPSDNRVCLYIRGSTEEQKNTLESQENSLRRYASGNSLDVAGVFVESGVSAYGTAFFDRPKVMEMLAMMRANGITQIAFTKLDRAFRNVKDCVNTLDSLAAEGINFHLVEQKVDTTNAMGRAFLQIMAILAELENGVRAERQIAAFTVMKDNHMKCGQVPFGWDTVSTDRFTKSGKKADGLVPNAFEQKVLKQITRYEQAGKTHSWIARFLNESAVPTKMGKKWFPASVASVLKNARFEDDFYETLHPDQEKGAA